MCECDANKGFLCLTHLREKYRGLLDGSTRDEEAFYAIYRHQLHPEVQLPTGRALELKQRACGSYVPSEAALREAAGLPSDPRDDWDYNQKLFIIVAGDNINRPVGPFSSEDEAHRYYQANKPRGMVYLSKPTIVALLAPVPSVLRGIA